MAFSGATSRLAGPAPSPTLRVDDQACHPLVTVTGCSRSSTALQALPEWLTQLGRAATGRRGAAGSTKQSRKPVGQKASKQPRKPGGFTITHVDVADDLVVLLDPKRERLIYVVAAEAHEQVEDKVTALMHMTSTKAVWIVSERNREHTALAKVLTERCKCAAFEVWAGRDSFHPIQLSMLQARIAPCPSDDITVQLQKMSRMADKPDKVKGRMKGLRPVKRRYDLDRARQWLAATQMPIKGSVTDGIMIVRNKDLESVWQDISSIPDKYVGTIGRALGFLPPSESSMWTDQVYNQDFKPVEVVDPQDPHLDFEYETDNRALRLIEDITPQEQDRMRGGFNDVYAGQALQQAGKDADLDEKETQRVMSRLNASERLHLAKLSTAQQKVFLTVAQLAKGGTVSAVAAAELPPAVARWMDLNGIPPSAVLPSEGEDEPEVEVELIQLQPPAQLIQALAQQEAEIQSGADLQGVMSHVDLALQQASGAVLQPEVSSVDVAAAAAEEEAGSSQVSTGDASNLMEVLTIEDWEALGVTLQPDASDGVLAMAMEEQPERVWTQAEFEAGLKEVCQLTETSMVPLAAYIYTHMDLLDAELVHKMLTGQLLDLQQHVPGGQLPGRPAAPEPTADSADSVSNDLSPAATASAGTDVEVQQVEVVVDDEGATQLPAGAAPEAGADVQSQLHSFPLLPSIRAQSDWEFVCTLIKDVKLNQSSYRPGYASSTSKFPKAKDGFNCQMQLGSGPDDFSFIIKVNDDAEAPEARHLPPNTSRRLHLEKCMEETQVSLYARFRLYAALAASAVAKARQQAAEQEGHSSVEAGLGSPAGPSVDGLILLPPTVDTTASTSTTSSTSPVPSASSTLPHADNQSPIPPSPPSSLQSPSLTPTSQQLASSSSSSSSSTAASRSLSRDSSSRSKPGGEAASSAMPNTKAGASAQSTPVVVTQEDVRLPAELPPLIRPVHPASLNKDTGLGHKDGLSLRASTSKGPDAAGAGEVHSRLKSKPARPGPSVKDSKAISASAQDVTAANAAGQPVSTTSKGSYVGLTQAVNAQQAASAAPQSLDATAGNHNLPTSSSSSSSATPVGQASSNSISSVDSVLSGEDSSNSSQQPAALDLARALLGRDVSDTEASELALALEQAAFLFQEPEGEAEAVQGAVAAAVMSAVLDVPPVVAPSSDNTVCASSASSTSSTSSSGVGHGEGSGEAGQGESISSKHHGAGGVNSHAMHVQGSEQQHQQQQEDEGEEEAMEVVDGLAVEGATMTVEDIKAQVQKAFDQAFGLGADAEATASGKSSSQEGRGTAKGLRGRRRTRAGSKRAGSRGSDGQDDSPAWLAKPGRMRSRRGSSSSGSESEDRGSITELVPRKMLFRSGIHNKASRSQQVLRLKRVAQGWRQYKQEQQLERLGGSSMDVLQAWAQLGDGRSGQGGRVVKDGPKLSFMHAARIVARVVDLAHRPCDGLTNVRGQDVVIVLPGKGVGSKPLRPADATPVTSMVFTDDGVVEYTGGGLQEALHHISLQHTADSIPVGGSEAGDEDEDGVALGDVLKEVASGWAGWEEDLLSPGVSTLNLSCEPLA